jgi:hypothetical protein
MLFPFKSYDYAALSITDLLDAREVYHFHLMNKKNVVATAIGYYRIRKMDDWPTQENPNPDNTKNKTIPRTLSNSEVRPYSWPAILVFVGEWQNEHELVGGDTTDIIPKTLFLENGKAVPICVIKANKLEETQNVIDFTRVNFPRNVISGGFPLLTNVQHDTHVACFGCLVTDGHLTYALTNQHVAGRAGSPISTILNEEETVVGFASDLQIGRVPFESIYPGLKGKNVYVNMDIGLIDITDINQWKAEVLGIGQMDKMIDLNVNNLTLKLINQKVVGFSGVSGQKIEGEIQALFYRYKSVGGFEYVSDFLIGPRTNGIPYHPEDAEKVLPVKYGDSGTILLLEGEKEADDEAQPAKPTYSPIGILWGMHQFQDDVNNTAHPFILGTFLSNVCNQLNVEIIRNWNLDLINTWGETGHFKIGALACELVSSHKLLAFLTLNQKNIGYVDEDLLNGNIVGGRFTRDFVPLTDVADIIWRTTRPNDESNHFSDVDETDDSVFDGKSLLELSFESDDNIDVEVWLDFDKQMDEVRPNTKTDPKTGEEKLRPRRGALPFRVWQMYKQMTTSLKAGDLLEFIVAGGTMSHYCGDACQPLHISFLHHGRDKTESNVHSDYESKLIDKKMKLLFDGVNAKVKKVKTEELIGENGKEAAKRILELMQKTVTILPPIDIVESWANAKGRGKFEKMWNDLGDRTIDVVAEGAHVLAILWQSAWKNGDGDRFDLADLIELDPDKLKKKYSTPTFVESFTLDNVDEYKSVL